jgi:hypothetical protein
MTLFGPEIYRHLAAATQHEWLELLLLLYACRS